MADQVIPRVHSALRVLVLCLDARTIDQLGEALQSMGIEMETCVDPQSAIRHLGRERFDALVLDWQQRDQAVVVLEFARNSRSLRTIIAFAITRQNSQAEDAFRNGVHFLIEHPIGKPRLLRVLRAGYGLMLRERRRSFRYAVSIPAFVSRGGEGEMHTVTLNVSEGGMAIVLPEGFATGDDIQIRFQLPDSTKWLRLKAEVCWSDDQRRGGLQFSSLPAACAEELQEWLARRLEQCSPIQNRTPHVAVAQSWTDRE